MNSVQEPTVRKTVTLATSTSRTRWQPMIGLVAGIVVMSVVVLSGQELKHVPPAAASFVVLHSFDGTDGANPLASLTRDAAGNLYGTTSGGGPIGYGVVFKLSPTGTETVLYSFTGGADGAGPGGALIRDTAANLYGTTFSGGDYYDCKYSSGCGVVFKLGPSGTETVLYSFTGGDDGANPLAGLVRDVAGNLYGTTAHGGAFGDGVVFKLGPSDTETVSYSFTGGADGGNPFAGSVRDTTGNLYGTTFEGGAKSSACSYFGNPTTCGVVFKLSPTGRETVLHSFTGSGGGNPWASLLRDTAGNLYGTTANGGAFGNGVVFGLIRCDTAASGYEFKVLHSFTGGADGGHPLGGLLRDAAGNLYGTTVNGGAKSSACTYFFENTTCGVVFKLSPTGTETVLHSFTGGADGGNPYYAGLIADATGNLYGTTAVGGSTTCGGGCGVVFKLTP